MHALGPCPQLGMTSRRGRRFWSLLPSIFGEGTKATNMSTLSTVDEAVCAADGMAASCCKMRLTRFVWGHSCSVN
jgi:hypothetical protein